MKTVHPGTERRIVLTAQRAARTEEPGPEDVHLDCTIGVVKTLLLMQNNMMKVLVSGEKRARIKGFRSPEDLAGGVPKGLQHTPFVVEVEERESLPFTGPEAEEMAKRLQSAFEEYGRLSKRFQADVPKNVASIVDLTRRADMITGYIPLKPADKQSLLEELDTKVRVDKLFELIAAEVEMLRMQSKVRGRFKKPSEVAGQPPTPPPQQADGPEDLQDEFKNELEALEKRLAEKPLTTGRERVARELKSCG